MPMIYRILGPFTVGDGRGIDLRRGLDSTVLGYLVVNANRRVSTDELLLAAWGRTDIDRTQLHKSISSLRRQLAGIGREGDIVTHAGHGYELRVTADDLDALQFGKLLREAEAAAGTEKEAGLLRRALDLWRAPDLLMGVPHDTSSWVRDDLRQRRKRALIRLYEIELERGNYDVVATEIPPIASQFPADVRLCESLMIALYRLGHVAEALAAYERYATAVEEQTAAPPDRELRSLRYAIAQNDEPAVAPRRGKVRPSGEPGPVATVPRQLPMDPADLVGRDQQIAAADQLLARRPGRAPGIVVLTGPGGIGKTALSIRIAHRVRDRFPDGQIYLELHGSGAEPVAAEELLGQVLRAFGVTDVPGPVSERLGLYRSVLSDRRVLIVLDDARDEAQIRCLMPGNPECAVIVTARRPLPDIAGAHHLPALEPLPLADASRLFHRIVGRSAVVSTTEPAATRAILELCAGLPLAICVAAALRASEPNRSAEDLAKRLADQRLGVLVHADRSVARSIGAGFDRLDDDAQLLFLGLGLVRLADISDWMAAAVLAGRASNPAAALTRLARHGLLRADDSGRFHCHDLTLEYARQRAERQISSAAQRLAIVERAYAMLLTLCRHAHRATYGGDFELVHSSTPDAVAPRHLLAEIDRAPFDWYERERANLRAAVGRAAEAGLVEICWDLAVSTHEFYNVRGYLDDWHAVHWVAHEACRRAGNVRGAAVMLTILNQPALTASGRPGATELTDLTAAATALRRCGDPHGEAIAVRTLANALRRRGHFAEALTSFQRALDLYQASGDTVGRWQTIRYIGQTRLDMGDPESALDALLSAAKLAYDSGRPRLRAQSAYWLGRAYLARGDMTRAETQFEYVLSVSDDGDLVSRAYALHGLGDSARLTGVRDLAARRLLAAAGLAHEGGDAVLEGRIHQSLADLHRSGDRPGEAAAALNRALSCFDSGGAPFLREQAAAALGAL